MNMTQTRVYALHGSAPAASPDLFVYRNICDRERLSRWLSALPPLVPLCDALAGRGSALTIDDATYAAADSALLARELGHEATLFVNPSNIAERTNYSWLVINALLDSLEEDFC